MDELVSIAGIGRKAAEEIVEEYKTKEGIRAAIKAKKFSVGGIGTSKIKLIMEAL